MHAKVKDACKGYQKVVEGGLCSKQVGAAVLPLHSNALVQQVRGGLACLRAAPAPDMLLLVSVHAALKPAVLERPKAIT